MDNYLDYFLTTDPVRLTVADDTHCCDTATESATKGHLVCLKRNFHLIEIVESDGFATIVANQAIKGGHIDCLKYLTDNGYRCDGRSLIIAVHCGHLNCLEYIYNIGITLVPAIISVAAERGNLDCLQFAFDHECEWEIPKVVHSDCFDFLYEVEDDWRAGIFPNNIKGDPLTDPYR